jgi:hypothetical protein
MLETTLYIDTARAGAPVARSRMRYSKCQPVSRVARESVQTSRDVTFYTYREGACTLARMMGYGRRSGYIYRA